MSVVVFDAVGIAAGGSGSAAGLVHPFSPKGKVRGCKLMFVLHKCSW